MDGGIHWHDFFLNSFFKNKIEFLSLIFIFIIIVVVFIYPDKNVIITTISNNHNYS